MLDKEIKKDGFKGHPHGDGSPQKHQKSQNFGQSVFPTNFMCRASDNDSRSSTTVADTTTLYQYHYSRQHSSFDVVSLLSFTAILCVQRLIGVVSTGSPRFVVMVTACLASWVTGVVFGSVPVVYAWIKYLVYSMLAVKCSMLCLFCFSFYFVQLHHVFFLLQVRPCRDAVCCLLGEQLLGHVGLHPLCFLHLYLPPLPPHPLLLSTECLRLPLKLHQVNHQRRLSQVIRHNLETGPMMFQSFKNTVIGLRSALVQCSFSCY